MEKKLHLRQGEWEKYLADEKESHEAFRAHATAHAAKIDSKWRQASNMMLEQWAMGDDAGALHAAFRSWHTATKVSKQGSHVNKRLEKYVKMGQGMLLKWMEGDVTGTVHSCLISWKSDVDNGKE